MKHIDELRVFLANNEIDLLPINETRLDATIIIGDNEVYIHGYEIVRRDRRLNGRLGGGVCIYIRNFFIRHDLSIDQLENLCIPIKKHKSKPFLVSTWHRPPSSPVEKFKYFESLLNRLDSENNIEFYLLGDLNCDLSSTVLDNGSRLLVDIANLFSLTQLIEEPTRITSSSSTLIDHIFTNTPNKVICAGVSHVGISDHSLIYACRKLSIDRPTKGHSSVNYRSFKNFDHAKFRHDIENQNWAYVGEFQDPDEMWYVWKAIFNSVVDKHAPFRTKRVRTSKSSWISSQLKDEMHKRDAQKIKAIAPTIL